MNHYPHHIGDFRSGTVNMTRLERWIYRDLIDFYYDKEKPLPLDIDVVCKEIGVRSDEERSIVVEILRFKFILTDKGFEHERCETVIAEYRVKAETAQQNGRLGGRPKKANRNPEKPTGFIPVSNPNPDETGSEANQEPITINQEPKEERAVVIQEAPRVEIPHDASPADRSVEIAVYLRQRGIVGSNSINPNISSWGDDVRVTNEILDAALSVVGSRISAGALERMPGPNYLKPIIADLLNPKATSPPRARNSRDESRAAAAASIGLGAQNHDAEPDYIDGEIRQID